MVPSIIDVLGYDREFYNLASYMEIHNTIEYNLINIYKFQGTIKNVRNFTLIAKLF